MIGNLFLVSDVTVGIFVCLLLIKKGPLFY